MSLFKKLFGGGGSKPDAPSETYKDFRITATPIAEGQAFRVAATIEKEVDGKMRRHELIRADTMQGLEAAQVASIGKAKQVIDEQGELIFR